MLIRLNDAGNLANNVYGVVIGTDLIRSEEEFANVTTRTLVSNGGILVGNTISGGFDSTTFSQGPGLIVTSGAGSITIDASPAYNAANIAQSTAQIARDAANASYNVANSVVANVIALVTDNVPETTSNLYFTAARVRANVSNTSPINYNSTTGTFSHADSGVNPTTYGNTTFIPQITVDSTGHVTAVTNVAFSGTSLPDGDKGDITVSGGGTIWEIDAQAVGTDELASECVTYSKMSPSAFGPTISQAGNEINRAPITGDVDVPIMSNISTIANSAVSYGKMQDSEGDAILVGRGAGLGSGNLHQITMGNGISMVGNTITANVLSVAGKTGHVTLVTDNVAETTTNLYFTSARVRSNVTNTSPINYDSTTGTFSHADSGVTPTTYGNTSFVPQITVDARGHVTSVSNVAITSTPDQFARDHANGAFSRANAAYNQANVATTNADAAFIQANSAALRANTLVTDNVPETTSNLYFTSARVRANISNVAPINYNQTTGAISHAVSGVTATTYGNTLFVSQVTIDTTGHVTSASNVAIDQSLAQSARDHANGAFSHANEAFSVANSAALRANTLVTDNVPETTTNLYFTSARVRANVSNTTPINYNSITGTFSHADSGVTATTYGNTTFIPQITVDSRGHVTAISNVALTSSPDQFARDHANGAFAHANGAFVQANSAALRANTLVTDNVPETTSNLYFTSARVRANISNTTPINYNPTTGVVSHADSGVTATTYGTTTTVPQITISSTGHITVASNVTIDQSLAQGAFDKANAANTLAQTSRDHANGAFAHANGAFGTANAVGVLAQTARDHANGAFLQANTSGTLAQTARDHANGAFGTANAAGVLAQLSRDHANGAFNQANTSGVLAQTARDHANGAFNQANTSGVLAQTARDHANGAFLQANTSGTLAQTARDHANGAFVQANSAALRANTLVTDNVPETTTNLYFTAARVRANVSNTAPINYVPATGIISHATSGVTAAVYGNASHIAQVTVDSFGHTTTVTNTLIALSASQITTGTLAVNRGGTGQTAITVNGSLLIANTVSGGYDVNTITAGAGVTVLNDKGSITISAAGGGGLANAFAVINTSSMASNTQANLVSVGSDTLIVQAGAGINVSTSLASSQETLRVQVNPGYVQAIASGASLHAI